MTIARRNFGGADIPVGVAAMCSSTRSGHAHASRGGVPISDTDRNVCATEQRPECLNHESHSKRRGYVLVMTLALLVVSAAVMVGVARLAIRETSLARQAQDDLQQRWAIASIRMAVLPNAERILESAEVQFHRPVPTLVASLNLGGQEFDIIVADEQAKANVNALLDRAPSRANATTAVETQLRAAILGKLAARLRLRPETLASRVPGTLPATKPTTQPGALAMRISGFGQVFDGVAPQDLMNMRYAVVSPASMLTCWGNGAINVRRASEASMRLMLAPPMSNLDISRVIDARGAIFKDAKSPGLALPSQPLSQSQPRAALTADPIRRLLAQGNIQPTAASRMTLSSSCHSLWIIAQSPGRQWYHFAVLDESNRDQPRLYTMRW